MSIKTFEAELANYGSDVNDLVHRAILVEQNDIAIRLLWLKVSIPIISEATGIHPSTLSMLKHTMELKRREQQEKGGKELSLDELL